MLAKTKAIVLSTLKYNEKSLIVRCFTQNAGLRSYFVRDAFSKSKTAMKIAYFQPLAILEIVGTQKNKGTLENIKEVRNAAAFTNLHSNIYKSAIVLFLSEMLQHSIREEEANEPLFDFLENAILWLDANDNAPDFHLVLLFQMSKYLGFYPDMTNEAARFMDIKEGVLVERESQTTLNAEESQLFIILAKRDFSSENNFYNGKERQKLLNLIVDYYALHLEGFKRPKSLVVLGEVFS